MDGRTNNPEAICPSNLFEVWGIKMHKLQAKIIPDCLFKCIFSIILKLSLHFKIISVPIYSEPQVKAPVQPDHDAFAANIVINFLRLDGARTYFFLRQNMKICANGTSWLEHCLPEKLQI